jgi:hypothetical protein
MESKLRTAILIDGSENPPAVCIEESERQAHISQGRAGNTPRNFKFIRPVTLKVDGEDEPRTVYLYRLVGGKFSDADFEALAQAEADKHLNPEKYMKVSANPLSTDERAELEAYRRQHGAGK